MNKLDPAKAQEGSTFGVKAAFVLKTSGNTVGSPITPNPGLKWSLRDEEGQTVNGKADVPISEASTIVIILSGADLAIPGGYPVRRFLTITGTYDSSLGENLPIKEEVSFQIENLVGAP